MKDNNTVKPTRQKSKETILKQDIRRLNRELATVQKKVDEFNALEKEMETMGAKRDQLKQELTGAKLALVKELGLD